MYETRNKTPSYATKFLALSFILSAANFERINIRNIVILEQTLTECPLGVNTALCFISMDQGCLNYSAQEWFVSLSDQTKCF